MWILLTQYSHFLLKKTEAMITKEKLVDLIEDLELSDEKLQQYFQVNNEKSNAFKGNLKQVLNLSSADG